jgi:hypothetical protein
MTGRLPARYGPVAFALAAPGYIVDTPITSVVATRRATVFPISFGHQFLKRRPGGAKSHEPVVSTREFVKSLGLAKLLQTTLLDSPWRRCQPGGNHRSIRISLKVHDELFNLQFRETELHYKNLDAASAQPPNVGLSRKRMLKTDSSRQSIA